MARPLNLLYLCAFIPSPADDGDKVRAMWTLRALASRHRIFGYFLSPDGRRTLPAELRALCQEAVVVPQGRWRRLASAGRALLSREPLHTRTFWNAAAHRRLEEARARWPVTAVHVHRIRMMPYAERLDLPYLLDCTDSIADYYRHPENLSGWRSAYARFDQAGVAAAERRYGNGARAVLAITSGERGKLQSLGIRRPVFVTPNGLDLFRWRMRRPPGPGRPLVFLGNLAYPPNQRGLSWFLSRVAPLLRRVAPKVALTVVGGGAPRSVQREGAAAAIPVRFAGFIPDVQAAYRDASALVCPLPYAAGMQNKALEAMATGLPVIATPNVAFALDARPRKEVLVAATPAAFAAHCQMALESGTAVRRMTVHARRFVERRYDRRVAARPVLAAAELLRGTAGRAR